ncbi:MAG: hypothetical protein M0Z45_03475 [Actinomycetota bacterium]|nr:hypothetical protein [Actinomycetota bacterium]
MWESLATNLSKITIPMLVYTCSSDSNYHSGGSMWPFQRVGSANRYAYVYRGPKWAVFYGEKVEGTNFPSAINTCEV